MCKFLHISWRTLFLSGESHSVASHNTRSTQPFRQGKRLPIELDAPMRHKVTLLPGEGIGPEVSRATQRILEAAGGQIDWEEIDARAAAGSPEAGGVVNEKAVESVR